MDKNIIALLNNNLRVIIPDFGAFIIRQKEPKIIVFNEFLRYNDGLLIENLVKTEGIEMEMARQQLSDYTEHAAKVLEKEKTFTIEGLGKLQKDNSGKILFIAESETGSVEMSPDIKEEPEIQLIKNESKTEPENKSEVKPEVKSEVKPKVKSDDRSETNITQETVTKLKQEKPAAEDVSANQVVLSINEEVNIPAELKVPVDTLPTKEETVPEALPVIINEKEVVNQTQDKYQYNAVHVTGQSSVMKKSTGNRANQILKWIAVILLANIAILAWFILQDNIRGFFINNKEPARITDSVFQHLSDSVIDAASDTSLIYRETHENTAIKESPPVQGNLRYYIVAGCFRDEVNADELVKSLKIKGFNAEKFGKIGNLYAVCFASYDDKELAVKELKRIREEIHPEAWMTRF
jgi:nucleoid DNA-binding protein